MITASRYHDFSAGHRVVGHENKCRWLHGHNYRVTFTAQAVDLDDVGRVVDFGVLKSRLCQWLEDNWDHKTLLWQEDPMLADLQRAGLNNSLVTVPFNPTAENMAQYLLHKIAPGELVAYPNVRVIRVTVEETRKCWAEATR